MAQSSTMAPPGGEYKKVSSLVKLPDFLPGMGTLYVVPSTLPAGPFLAYDREGKPKIDRKRVAIVGFSFGGEVAHLTALASLRAALQSGETRFAAHGSYYPAGVYGAAAEAGAYTGAPILLLLGEKDDNLAVAKVDGYLTYAKAAGAPAPIDVKIYPGGQHAWTVATLGPLRFYPEYGSTKKCPFILLGSRGPALLIDGRAKPFDPNVIGACLREGQGYSMGYDAEVRARSTAHAMTFLQRQLMP